MYRKDRIPRLVSNIKRLEIQKDFGWCDDPNSNKYNQLIKLPTRYSAEKLHKKDNTYDIVLVLDYNMNPVKKNKGSAIFIHVAKKDYQSTEGCIAVKKKDLKNIVKIINKKTLVKIY